MIELSETTMNGLRAWAKELYDDDFLFDDGARAPEFWAWIWFQLRESTDNPAWFPYGKRAVLRDIERQLQIEVAR